MIAVRGRQTGLQELCPARIPADHVVDLGVGHRHLCRQVGSGAGPDRRIGGQAFADAADALLGAVVRGADQIDLAELRVDLQQPVVTVGGFDGGNERQQQILGR